MTILAIAAALIIVVFVIVAVFQAKAISARVLQSILDPLHAIEEVAMEVITKEVTSIADTLQTQAKEIQEINEGIEQINDVVQTNSATSEECAAASQEMSGEAESLREMIRKFKAAEFDEDHESDEEN